MARPDRADALLVLNRLHDVGGELAAELEPRDTDGRSFALGVCMWLGTVLSAIPLEHREEFCEGAMGYADRVDDVLDELKRDKKGQTILSGG
jgi:hypothetical protein